MTHNVTVDILRSNNRNRGRHYILLSIQQDFYLLKSSLFESRDSAVGIATGYGLDYQGVGVRVPVGQEFLLLHVVQTGSRVHPTSYPMGTNGPFPGGKAAGA
jgi:hypothetical protein